MNDNNDDNVNDTDTVDDKGVDKVINYEDNINNTGIDIANKKKQVTITTI